MAPSHVARRRAHRIGGERSVLLRQCHRRRANPNSAQVTSADAARVAANFTSKASVTDPYDINRDGVVDANDVAPVNANLTTPSDSLTSFLSRRRPSPCWRALHPATLPETRRRCAYWSDVGGESRLTYTWLTIGTPPRRSLSATTAPTPPRHYRHVYERRVLQLPCHHQRPRRLDRHECRERARRSNSRLRGCHAGGSGSGRQRNPAVFGQRSRSVLPTDGRRRHVDYRGGRRHDQQQRTLHAALLGGRSHSAGGKRRGHWHGKRDDHRAS